MINSLKPNYSGNQHCKADSQNITAKITGPSPQLAISKRIHKQNHVSSIGSGTPFRIVKINQFVSLCARYEDDLVGIKQQFPLTTLLTYSLFGQVRDKASAPRFF